LRRQALFKQTEARVPKRNVLHDCIWEADQDKCCSILPRAFELIHRQKSKICLTLMQQGFVIARFTIYKEKHHEAHLSTIGNQKKTHSRIFGAHENARWARRDQCASCQGPCQTCSLTNQPNLLLRIVCCASKGLTALFTRKVWQKVISGFFLLVTIKKTPGWVLLWPKKRFLVQQIGITQKESSGKRSAITTSSYAALIWL